MITVFIGTFNRLDTLTRTIDSYDQFKTPHELVLVDNGSDHPRCIALLEQLADDPRIKKVYPLAKINSMEALTDNYNIAVRDQYHLSCRRNWFAITDADICFEGTNPKALERYVRLARATGFAVGPHTRVDAGIPYGYPLRSRVLCHESKQLYKYTMKWHRSIPYSQWGIDTTFHLFPRTNEFRRRHMDTVRVGPPYDAMHLDWYMDITNPTEENHIYLTSPGTVGSWGKGWLLNYWLLYQQSPELLFHVLENERKNEDDFCNASFILSWCYQFGHGCEVDMAASQRWLDSALHPNADYLRERRNDWLQMIYRDDFSPLGW